MREQEVLDVLRCEGPMSRAAIARRCQVSKPTVSSIVQTLLEAELVLEQGRDPSPNGRPGRLLAFNARAGYVIGIDVGGTTTRAVLADLQGQVVGALRVATERGPAPALVAQLGAVAHDLAARGGATGRVANVVICTPGVVDRARRRIAIAPNLPALETDGFLDRLDATFGVPLLLLNDVNAATLGELHRGAGAGLRDLVYLNVGTGLGLGLVIGGSLHHGVAGRAGEFGLVPYPPGLASTLEEALSGEGLRRRHLAAGGSGAPEDAFREAEAGCEPGASLVSTFLDDLAWALSAVGTLLDPERIVLGGGIGLRCVSYLAAIRDAVARNAGFDVDLAIAQLGDDAGLTGAVETALAPARRVERWRKGGRLAHSA